MYIYLRSNRNIYLVSLSYYAKYAKPRDYTRFRYININIANLAKTNTGINII